MIREQLAVLIRPEREPELLSPRVGHTTQPTNSGCWNVRTCLGHGQRRRGLARLRVVGDDWIGGVEERRRLIAEGPHARLGVQPCDYADKLGALASLIGRSVDVQLLAGARVRIQIAGLPRSGGEAGYRSEA